jgi:hypothetical protein
MPGGMAPNIGQKLGFSNVLQMITMKLETLHMVDDDGMWLMNGLSVRMVLTCLGLTVAVETSPLSEAEF